MFSTPSVWAAGTCGSGGVEGERVEVEFQGSVYYLTTPADYTGDTPWPLIMGLHGDEGDPESSVNWFWRDVPDGTFIFVAPKAPNPSGSWYEEQESNEAWMDALYESLRASYNVDLDRTYIWGLSGGAVFSSRYVAARQGVLAAAQFNMGGSGTRNYVDPPSPECKIKARFAISDTDFLLDGAQDYYTLLTENGHLTEWVTADCEDHCWEAASMQDSARDWLLSHTLCDRVPTTGCSGDPADPDSPDGGDPTSPGDPPGGTGGGSTNGSDGGDPTSPGDPPGGTGGGSTNGSDGGDPAPEIPEGEMAGAVSERSKGCSVGLAGAGSDPKAPLVILLGGLSALFLGRRRKTLKGRGTF